MWWLYFELFWDLPCYFHMAAPFCIPSRSAEVGLPSSPCPRHRRRAFPTTAVLVGGKWCPPVFRLAWPAWPLRTSAFHTLGGLFCLLWRNVCSDSYSGSVCFWQWQGRVGEQSLASGFDVNVALVGKYTLSATWNQEGERGRGQGSENTSILSPS